MFALLLRLWPSLVASTQVLAVCGVLLGSISYQFLNGELPCPLCVIQRLCFLLACTGPLVILRMISREEAGVRIQARGFALCILASLPGALTSMRQVLLHITAGDPGYGPPVMGMHLYSWAFVVFACLMFGSALGLLGLQENPLSLPRWFTTSLNLLVLAIATIIVLSTIVMEGWHWVLPDNPVHYELLREIGL